MTDWQIGDLALAVGVPKTKENAYAHAPKGQHPHVGNIYKVVAITSHAAGLCLHIDEYPRPAGWVAICFRKIRPDAEPCEAEFTTLIKRCAPAREGQDA